MTYHIYLEGSPVYRVNIIAAKIVDEGEHYTFYNEKDEKIAVFRKDKVLGYDASEF